MIVFFLVSLLPTQILAQEVTATSVEVDAFVQADSNGDQMLTRSEFKRFVQVMAEAGQPTARQIRMFGAYGFAFKVVDKNGDGLASPIEMRESDNSHRAAE